jgi:hypothetical protein
MMLDANGALRRPACFKLVSALSLAVVIVVKRDRGAADRVGVAVSAVVGTNTSYAGKELVAMLGGQKIVINTSCDRPIAQVRYRFRSAVAGEGDRSIITPPRTHAVPVTPHGDDRHL